MRGIFFYTVCIGFACGILLRSFFNIGIEGVGLLLTIAFVCAVVWRQKSAGFLSPLFLVCLFILPCVLGVTRLDSKMRDVPQLSHYVDSTLTLRGVVVREPSARANGTHLTIAPYVDETKLNERVLVSVAKFVGAERVKYGDTLSIRGALKYPKAFETDGGRTFAYPEYLRAQGIEYVMYDATIESISPGEPSFLRILYEGKHRFIHAIERAIPHPHAGLSEGILLGVKRALGESLDEVFRKTGIIHIVVLSGYNVLIVVETLMYALSYVCRLRTRMYVGIVCIALFALLVGMSATVVRACIMASLLMVARGTGRVYGALRGLAIAGVVMLALNPYLLVHDVGFQLSFVATLGLLLFSPYIERHLTLIPTCIGMRNIITATIATQIAVLPLLLYQTGMLSLVSVIVNALVLPMVPVAMLLTFFTGSFGLISTALASVFGYLTYLSLSYIIIIATWFAELPFSAKIISVFPFWIVCIAYIILGIWYGMRMRVAIEPDDTPTDPALNEYAGWVIEEENNDAENEKEKSAETRSVSADTSPLPFR